MTARLVCIGDSLTQGFQHGAARRTQWSFPAMVANVLGAQPFRSADFRADGCGGPLLDLELLLDRLAADCGTRLDLWEVPGALLTIRRLMSTVEDYWERGPGTEPSATGPLHHNLGVWGFDVRDVLTLSDAVCARNIPRPRDNLIRQLPEMGMYRSARRVLNPARRHELAELTQLGAAREIAKREGIENLLVGVGANNALGTCVTLQIRPSDSQDLQRLAHERECNLWAPEHFAVAYRELAHELEAIGAARVFVSTIPHVTIAPVTRGVSPHARVTHGPEREGGYYEYYTRFWTWDRHFNPLRNPHLTRQEARHIDATIDAYNACIEQEARERGFHVIDLCRLLDELAFRRNAGRPPYVLPQGLVDALQRNPLTRFRVRPDGQVLLDTRFMRIPREPPPASADSDAWRAAYRGGLFGLDGVHPTTTGYGIIASEVLSALASAGVSGAAAERLDWESIVEHDTLLTKPPTLLVSLEATLDALFAKLPLDALIEKLGGYGAEAH